MADNVVALFPGAGSPAPGPRVTADLDAVGDRYTALLEARHRGNHATVRRLEGACADDVPGLVTEIGRKEALRRELADEVDRLRGVLADYGVADYDPDYVEPARPVVTVLLPGVS